MNTKGIQDPQARDLIEQLVAEQKRLNDEVEALKKSRPVMLERARQDDITTPKEGQLIIDPDGSMAFATDEGAKVFADGAWRAFVSVPDNAPWATIFQTAAGAGTGTELPAGHTSGFPAVSIGSNLVWSDNPGTDYSLYDYADEDLQVFDISGDHLAGHPDNSISTPIGVKKKGLYLCIVQLRWDPDFGRLNQLQIDEFADNPAQDGAMAPTWGAEQWGFFSDEMVEANDAHHPVTCWTIQRNTSDHLHWLYVQGRHMTADREVPFSAMAVIQLAENLNDTDPFEGGTI